MYAVVAVGDCGWGLGVAVGDVWRLARDCGIYCHCHIPRPLGPLSAVALVGGMVGVGVGGGVGRKRLSGALRASGQL